MRIKQIMYWLSTAVLCSIFLYSAFMYFTNTEMVKGFFENFSYPTYIVIPLAVAKIIGVVIVLWRPSQWLIEWAYAGLFFNLVFATAAHHYAGDGILGFSLYGLIVILPSYFLGKYIRV
ncbi:DoxX family protein [Winogradskyella sp. UBA3174]|uniref:DoxX family protein n=1 Tax=Winogradskyella sp. UBA3174 TaxID=1947785 RepID=UPI0025E42AD8|nr:DoxX family protein [Winogradskyella sp. UBA3174]|tara:strand:+ start:20025 stop:20381 length:357 start_codon:yes stop_codon:yes gene_type:complete